MLLCTFHRRSCALFIMAATTFRLIQLFIAVRNVSVSIKAYSKKMTKIEMDGYHTRYALMVVNFDVMFILIALWIDAGVVQGVFRRGFDSSDEGAKIWFSRYYKCQKSSKQWLFAYRRGLGCSDGGYSPLSPPLAPPLDRRIFSIRKCFVRL